MGDMADWQIDNMTMPPDDSGADRSPTVNDVREGDWIMVTTYTMGYATGEGLRRVELFRHCLGVFRDEVARRMGDFVPLCDLYGRGPDSEEHYMPNRGSYWTNPVPAWRMVEVNEEDDEAERSST